MPASPTEIQMDWFGTDPAPGNGVRQVSEISALISDLLDDKRLQKFWVEGEVTNYHNHRASGHRYFSLTEQNGRKNWIINCVMWKGAARSLPFEPVNGMKVLVQGSVQVYEPHGKYQIIACQMRETGAGEKHLLVDRWKRELGDEGLFENSRKVSLPRFPEHVGVVTAAGGAARRDIENIISRRFPVKLLLSPTSVQGEGAPAEIATALRRIDGLVDVIILGRGGGSFEDLFAFSHPDVVRAIAGCTTPVVSAVGHEVDWSLSDLAADLRAPTPSAAAELVVPDRMELAADLGFRRAQIRTALEKKLERSSDSLENLRYRLQPHRVSRRIDTEKQQLADLQERLLHDLGSLLEKERLRIESLGGRLRSADPALPISRGYACLIRDGQVVTSVQRVSAGDHVEIRMAGGQALAEIKEVKYENEI